MALSHLAERLQSLIADHNMRTDFFNRRDPERSPAFAMDQFQPAGASPDTKIDTADKKNKRGRRAQSSMTIRYLRYAVAYSRKVLTCSTPKHQA